MTSEQYFQFAEETMLDMIALSRSKNADYTGGSVDPFGNFKAVEILGISTEIGFLTRMMDKMKRISTFVNRGQLQVKDEAVEDTLKDLANYCILFMGYLESKKQLKGYNVPPDSSFH
jgi:hypothetical protein